jgi:hypothetical protein
MGNCLISDAGEKRFSKALSGLCRLGTAFYVRPWLSRYIFLGHGS